MLQKGGRMRRPGRLTRRPKEKWQDRPALNGRADAPRWKDYRARPRLLFVLYSKVAPSLDIEPVKKIKLFANVEH